MDTQGNKQNDKHDESFRDHISTINEEGKRAYVYPTKPFGKYYDLRTYFTWFYLIVFFTVPFIKYNGEPLFLFNVPEKIYFIRFNFLGSRFLHLWIRNAHLYCVYRLIYSRFW